MAEDIIEKVKHDVRASDLFLLGLAVEEVLYPDQLQEYIAAQIEMAYIAGANRLDVNDIPSKGIDYTGQTLVLARGYVKDKGYRI